MVQLMQCHKLYELLFNNIYSQHGMNLCVIV